MEVICFIIHTKNIVADVILVNFTFFHYNFTKIK